MTYGEPQSTLARIQTALSSPDRQATIHDVKRAVIDEFQHVDQRVDIEVTDYFRHSYVPDLVLRWRDDVDRPERWVFLRSKVRPDYLLADVALIARDQPIIFGLVETTNSDTDDTDVHDAGLLKARSVSTGTLITDPTGLGALSSPTANASTEIPNLVSRQIIRGGRGIYDKQTSTDTTATINAGFAAAFSTGAEQTFKAAASIREHLGERSGERLLRLLLAIWVASGGRSDQFPEAPSVAGPLSDDALTLLIAGDEIEDEDFWRRLGPVTLPQLGRLNLGDRPSNLGRLINVNVDGIEGRRCRVRGDEPRIGSDGRLEWGIEHRMLALHGATFTAYFAEEKATLEAVEPVEGVGIDVDDLAVRAELAEANISDFTGSGDGLIVAVASETDSDVLANPHTSDTAGAAAGNIKRARATLKNGHAVVCDFTTATASSRSRATLTLRELARHALPLVWAMSDDDAAGLADLLAAVTALTDDRSLSQDSLFSETSDDIDDGDGDGDDNDGTEIDLTDADDQFDI